MPPPLERILPKKRYVFYFQLHSDTFFVFWKKYFSLCSNYFFLWTRFFIAHLFGGFFKIKRKIIVFKRGKMFFFFQKKHFFLKTKMPLNCPFFKIRLYHYKSPLPQSLKDTPLLRFGDFSIKFLHKKSQRNIFSYFLSKFFF